MSALRLAAAAAACAVFGITQAGALPLVATSYDMKNGNGSASGGSFNYWDISYTGTGSVSGAGPKTSDGETLSGGLGDLTDGVITDGVVDPVNWFAIETLAGTGPYVGWCASCGPASVANPTVVFRFSPSALETYVFDSVTLHLDDSNGAGGVEPPSSIAVSVDGGPAVDVPVIDPAGGAPYALTIPLGGLAGSEVAVTLRHDNQWIFLSEVTFDGAIIIRDDFGVPAPASLALLAIGLAGLAALRRGGSA